MQHLSHSRCFSHRPLPFPPFLPVLGLGPSGQRPPSPSFTISEWLGQCVSFSFDILFPLVCLHLSHVLLSPINAPPSPSSLLPACSHWSHPESPSAMPRPLPASTPSPSPPPAVGCLKQALFPEHWGLESRMSLQASVTSQPGPRLLSLQPP